MGQTLACRNNAQNKHVYPKKDVWLHVGQCHDHVTRNFDQDKGNEEDPYAGVGAIGRHIQPLLQTLNASIGDYEEVN